MKKVFIIPCPVFRTLHCRERKKWAFYFGGIFSRSIWRGGRCFFDGKARSDVGILLGRILSRIFLERNSVRARYRKKKRQQHHLLKNVGCSTGTFVQKEIPMKP
jgi:hypothetical protein